tara:strand:- start:44 stop:406 length:363 start_codon:yes stop_codon:yes gene_type:complete
MTAASGGLQQFVDLCVALHERGLRIWNRFRRKFQLGSFWRLSKQAVCFVFGETRQLNRFCPGADEVGFLDQALQLLWSNRPQAKADVDRFLQAGLDGLVALPSSALKGDIMSPITYSGLS